MNLPRTEWVLFLALIGLLAGCEEDGIRRHRAPRPPQAPARSEPAEHAHADHPAGRTDPAPEGVSAALRTLAAIIPDGDQVWFFKMTGPAAQIEPQVANFDRLLDSLKFGAAADRPIDWSLPPGWSAKEGSGMRFATLIAGEAAEAPELTVIPLGIEAGDVLPNVNRWREQLGLPAIGAADLGRDTRPLKVGGRDGVRVELATGGASTGASEGTKPVGETPGSSAAPTEPGFTVPEGWVRNAGNTMALAAFTVTDADRKVEISVTPLSGAAGGLLANINRWCAQIHLPPLGEAELIAVARKGTIAGQNAVFVDLDPGASAGAARERILGAILVRDQVTWFFKMKGAADLVEKQQAAFESWLTSMTFVPARAGDAPK